MLLLGSPLGSLCPDRCRMKPVTPVGSPSPLRLLNKGPEYLRKQIESDNRSRALSAVERLEADKPKYVKSQQAMTAKQEAGGSPCASPSFGGNRVRPCEARVPCQELNSRKENTNMEELNNARNILLDKPSHDTVVTRRTVSKRVMRPDSLVIYRQKRDCKIGSTETSRGYNFIRRLFQGSMRDKQMVSLETQKVILKEDARSFPEGNPHTCQLTISDEAQTENHCVGLVSQKEVTSCPTSPTCITKTENLPSEAPKANGQVVLRNRTLQRSNSDLPLRNSVALSEKDRFFNYCGLDLDVVDCLGMSKFSPANSDSTLVRVQNTGLADSEGSEFSGWSRDGEGLYEEEIHEQISSGISVIERNARVIKWLYSCKKAKEGPKESTV
ncbi:protein FAM110C [Mobula birostris]|uniref:protein FAM110C n=1 Tax=Mobula birostris TaxID=1983395 RepID=UPI003B284609